MTGFENKVAGFIRANALFDSPNTTLRSTSRVLLAVSGGADSTALLYAMCALKAENILSAELICAHINHQLRGAEADKDEDFVVAEAEKLKLPVITKRVEVRGFAQSNKLSIETAARKLRIENLLDIAKTNNCDAIGTAHQKNDNAETILQRLSRGTGFRGLGGIWPRRIFDGNINFVRPLLCVGRDEIIEYLKKRNLKWRDDHTNADCSYRRNFIRHRLLPALQQPRLPRVYGGQECSGSVVEQLFDLSGKAQRFYSLVCSEAEKVWPNTAEASGEKVTLNLKSFLDQPQPVKVELVRRALARLGSGERDLTHRHYEKILQLAEQADGGKKITLPNGFTVQREYTHLIFTCPKESFTVDEQISNTVELNIPGQTKFGGHVINVTILEKNKGFEKFKAEKTSFVEWFDIDKVKLPLVVRSRQVGDRFWPLGLAQEKKVGKFLTAEKVPQEMRKKVLIIADNEKIIWLWPVRISEQAKVTNETKKILQLKVAEPNTVQEAVQKYMFFS